MKPVRFSCVETLSLPPEAIAAQILDVANWPDFAGYGPLPGIESAVFERREDGVVGSRIRVTNRDGSAHVEEIVEWDVKHRLRLRMHEFSPPLSRLATEFFETWELTQCDAATRVVRSFEMVPRSVWSRPLLWMISKLLKRAISRHLRQLRDAVAHGDGLR